MHAYACFWFFWFFVFLGFFLMYILGWFLAAIYPVSIDLCAYSTFMMYYHSLLCTAGIQHVYLKREVPCLGICCMVNKERQSPVEHACSAIKEMTKYRGWLTLCFRPSLSRKGRDTLQVHPDSWQTGIPCQFKFVKCSHKRSACTLQELKETGVLLGASPQSTDPCFSWLAGTRTWGAQYFFGQ